MFQLTTLISRFHPNFPQIVEQVDNAAASVTKGHDMWANLMDAEAKAQSHSQGPFHIVAAYDPDPEKGNKYRCYVGIDKDMDVWLFNVGHGEHWIDEDLKERNVQGHPNGLCYEMKYMWEPIEGRMDDEFEEGMNRIIGSITGTTYHNESVENAGCYPGMR